MSNRRRPTHRWIVPGIAAGLGASLLSGLPARADLTDVDLPGGADLRIDGAAAGDNAGRSVAGAGDINGDGVDDMLVGAPGASANSRSGSGSTFVVFGGGTGPVDLDDLGARGFRIDGEAADDRSGNAVAGVGDLNGDGKGDLLIGAPGADNNGRIGSGSSYVVFGSASTGTVDLDTLGARGFRIDGQAAADYSGQAVAGIPDINGDGTPDLFIGAPNADNNSRDGSGSSYVVFGDRSTTTVDLDALGARGFRIDGENAKDRSGFSVAAAGDVNSDGKGDLFIGAPNAGNNTRNYSGSSYVVLGGSTDPLDLQALGNRGFRIDGASAYNSLGRGASAGDVNGDGIDDLVVGASGAGNNQRIYSGSAYVIFGGDTDPLDLQAPGNRAFRIDGAAEFDNVGSEVAGVGDTDGDGLDDIVVAAPGADNNGRYASGTAYVILGGNSNPLDLLALGNRGVSIDGAAEFDYAGRSVAGIGDVNGDGGADILIGAPGANSNARADSGSAYVVFGTPPPPPGPAPTTPPTGPPTAPPPTTAPPATTPAATLGVKARKKTKKVKRTGRTKLVRSITVGPGQTARVKVTIRPKKARKTVKVKKSVRRVVVRTKGTRKKTRIRVRIIARGPGYTPTKWARTWRVR